MTGKEPESKISLEEGDVSLDAAVPATPGSPESHPVTPMKFPEFLPGITSEHPSECSDERVFGPFRFIGMSIIGSKNQANGTPREDAYAAAPLPGGGLVVAVADGVSAADSSRVAAMAAATAAVRCVGDSSANPASWESRCQLAVKAAQDAIAVAESFAPDRPDVRVLGAMDQLRGNGASTTLAFAEVCPLESEVQLHWCALGDTQVMLVKGLGLGPVEPVSHPGGVSGDHAPGQLGGTTMHGDPMLGEVKIGLGDWVLIGTDGAVEAPLRARSREFAATIRAWAPSDSNLRDLLQPLMQAQVKGVFAARDDRTAIFVGPAGGSATVAPQPSAGVVASEVEFDDESLPESDGD